MDPLRDIGVIDKLGRPVLVGRVDQLDEWPSIATEPGKRFVFLLVTDGEAPSVDQCSLLADDLLDRGCAYFSSWGPGCELAHDVLDESIVWREVDAGREITNNSPLIMTDWHSKWTLRETIWFFMRHTKPDESMEEGVDTSVALVCGSPELFDKVVATFRDDLDDDPDIFPRDPE